MPERTLDIFAHAMDLSGDERHAYLENACHGDPALRQEVEALILADADAGEFLVGDAPTLDLATAKIGEKAGDVIGRYKLLQPIGEGGFGVVFMAEQTHPVRRRVALKIIKLGMDTKQVVARFEAERQALAMMDHPNIASVLDAGATENGRPYFVMELVNGVPITEYCDANKLGTRERLELFADVCAAVQHAHQQGIIHRDIKPSNVLVTLHDGQPVPKIIDFGIAKATNARLTEKTLFTEFRQFIGTPEYVSPEQAEYSGLGVDTRSDVYSLGVLLYELLTGVTPFDGKALRAGGFDSIQRVIKEQDPPAPSTRVSTLGARLTEVARHRRVEPSGFGATLRGELDWIVLKAIEKDRRRRYESASAFAADVRRHLAGDIVEASPASRAYRLRKAFARHRAAFMTSGAVAAALVVGLAGTTTMFLRAESSKRDAVAQFQEAERAREDADALNEYFMTVFGEIGFGTAGSTGQAGATELSALEVIERALAIAPDTLEGKPMLEVSVRLALSSAVLALGDADTSNEQRHKIAELYTQAGLADDDPRVLANEIHKLLPVGPTDPSDDEIDRALALETRLRERADPCDLTVISVWENIGHNLMFVNRNEEALAFLQDRVSACDWTAAPTRVRAAGMRTKVALGWSLAEAGRHDEAESVVREVIEQSEAGLSRGYAQLGLGQLLGATGRYDEACEMYERGLNAFRSTVGESHPYTLRWRGGYLMLLVNAGRQHEARAELGPLLDAIAGRFGAVSPESAYANFSASYVALANDDPDAAERYIITGTDAVDAMTDTVPAELLSGLRGFAMLDRVTIARMRGQTDAVLEAATGAIDAITRIAPDRLERTLGVQLYRELGYAHALRDDTDAARAAFERARRAAATIHNDSAPWQQRLDRDLAALERGTLDHTRYTQPDGPEPRAD